MCLAFYVEVPYARNMGKEKFSGGSPLFQGCMGLGGPWEAEGFGTEELRAADAAIRAALDAGITRFDHADIYSRGKSEAVFGAVLGAEPGLRDRMFIQTKCGIRPAGSASWKGWNRPTGDERQGHDPGRYDFSAKWIVSAVEGSLARLRCGRIDRLLLHRPDPLMEVDEVAEAFSRLSAEGKVAGFGVSNFSAAQIGRLGSALAERGFRVEANQVELSLLHHDLVEAGIMVNQRGWAAPPWRGEFDGAAGSASSPTAAGAVDLAPFCVAEDIELQAWGCLAQGRLSGRVLPRDAPKAVFDSAKLVSHIASERAVSEEAVVLAWLLRLPWGVRPVIGTTDPARIRRCAIAATFELSREEWYALYEAARGAGIP
jgi:predicted oxidoreductase